MLYTDIPLLVFKADLNLFKWAILHDFKKGKSGRNPGGQRADEMTLCSFSNMLLLAQHHANCLIVMGS